MQRLPFAVEADAPATPGRMLAVAVALSVAAATLGWVGSSFAESLGAGDRNVAAASAAAAPDADLLPVLVARLGN